MALLGQGMAWTGAVERLVGGHKCRGRKFHRAAERALLPPGLKVQPLCRRHPVRSSVRGPCAAVGKAPGPSIIDSEGIRTPAGRAQWISSPSP